MASFLLYEEILVAHLIRIFSNIVIVSWKYL